MPRLSKPPSSSLPFLSAPITDQEAAAMCRAVLRLFTVWDVSDAQAARMLDLPYGTFSRWKAGQVGRMERDSKIRLSNLLGIYRALKLIFSEPSRGYAWLKAGNETFGGASALDVMARGGLADLVRVRRYLEAECAS